MSNFQLSPNIDSNKIFLRKRSTLENRLDPHQYHPERLNSIEALFKNNQCLKLRHGALFQNIVTNIMSENDVYVGLENIESNTGKYIPSTEKNTISSANIFKKGQILFPKLRPYLNKVYLAEFDGVCSTEFHVLNANDRFLDEFLAIYLRLNIIVNQTKHLMTGNTLPRLQTQDIYNLPVPIISIEKQREIVSIYNRANNNKLKKEQKAQNLLDSIDDYLMKKLGIELPEVDNSLKNRVFFIKKLKDLDKRLDPIFYYSNYQTIISSTTYPILKLGEIIVSAKSGFGAGKNDQVDSFEEGIIHIRPTNINRIGQIIVDRTVFVPKQENIDTIQIGDILFNNTNSQELVGKTLLYDQTQKSYIEEFFQVDNLEVLYFSNHITRIRVNELIAIPAYFALILNSYQKNNIFYSLCTNWNNQSGIGSNVLNSLKIPVPDLKVQNTIVEYIESIRKKATLLKNEAQQQFEDAKKEIEQIILGESL